MLRSHKAPFATGKLWREVRGFIFLVDPNVCSPCFVPKSKNIHFFLRKRNKTPGIHTCDFVSWNSKFNYLNNTSLLLLIYWQLSWRRIFNFRVLHLALRQYRKYDIKCPQLMLSLSPDDCFIGMRLNRNSLVSILDLPKMSTSGENTLRACGISSKGQSIPYSW